MFKYKIIENYKYKIWNFGLNNLILFLKIIIDHGQRPLFCLFSICTTKRKYVLEPSLLDKLFLILSIYKNDTWSYHHLISYNNIFK